MFQILIILTVLSLHAQCEEKFTILQFNDINGQLESFQEGTDPPKPSSSPNAVGGLAKLIAELEYQEKAISDASTTILRISAGNLIGGFNGWLSVLGFEPYGKAVKSFYSNFTDSATNNIFLQGFGLKEFEAGIKQTNTYIELFSDINDANKPILSNIKCDGENFQEAEDRFCGHHRDEANFVEYKTVTVGTKKVGVVGFLHPLAMNLSDPGNLVVEDVVTAIETVIKKPDFADIETIIAIGGGSLEIARDILNAVPKVKLVVYAGGRDSPKYPTEYNGKYIAATASLKYGAMIGKLTFTIKEDGSLGLDTANSQLLPVKERINSNIQKWVTSLKYSGEMNATMKPIGNTLVRLEGTRKACWQSECNLGNLVTDSFVHCALNKLHGEFGTELDDVFAVWNGGALFNDTVPAHSDIRGIDVHQWLPYHNNAYLVKLAGFDLKQMFQTAGKAIMAPNDESIEDWGSFLQVSDGVQLSYKSNGELNSVKVWHMENQVPILQEVDGNKDYIFVLPSTLHRGRNSYRFLLDKFLAIKNGDTFVNIDFDDNCVRNYIEAMGVLKTGFQGRIFIGDDVPPGGGGGSTPCSPCSKGTGTTVFLTLLIYTIILAIIYAAWKFVWPIILHRRRTSSFP